MIRLYLPIIATDLKGTSLVETSTCRNDHGRNTTGCVEICLESDRIPTRTNFTVAFWEVIGFHAV
jgi:hypothetical protein